jgi:hypothetical protein
MKILVENKLELGEGDPGNFLAGLMLKEMKIPC